MSNRSALPGRHQLGWGVKRGNPTPGGKGFSSGGVAPAGIGRESSVMVAEALSLESTNACLELAGPPVLEKCWPDVPSRLVAPSVQGRTVGDIDEALERVGCRRGQQLSAPGENYVDALLDSYRPAVRTGRTS